MSASQEAAVPKSALLFLAMCFLGLVLLFAFLGYYSFPIADDHAFALDIQSKGAFGLFKHMYFTASGRYTANILYSVSPYFVGSPALYHCIAVIQLSMLTMALRLLVAATHKGDSLSAWTVTFGLAAVFMAGLPSPSQGLYWLCGSIVYFVSFTSVFFLLACVANLVYGPATKKNGLMRVAPFLWVIVIMGGNEITALVTVFFLFLAMVLSICHNHRYRKIFIALFSLGAVFFLLSFLAPGNFSRMGVIDEQASRSWEWKFVLSALGGAFQGYKWLFYTPLIPLLALVSMLFQPKWSADRKFLPYRNLAVLTLILGCVLFFNEYLLVYVTSKRAPYARITNAIYHGTFVFTVLAWAFFLPVIQKRFHSIGRRFGGARVIVFLGILTLCICLGQKSVRNAVYNLATGQFAAYRNVWMTRLAMIPPRGQGHHETLVMPALQSRPFPLVFRDLAESQEKHQWIKDVFAAYHGVAKVEIEQSATQPKFSEDE